MTVELPLWLVIIFLVLFGINILHLLFGDLLAKIIYKALKDKEKRK